MAKQRSLFDAKDADRNTIANANVEPNPVNAAFRAGTIARFSAPCRIHFHHVRKRLADLDNLCGKAVLDQLVRVGVFADDSPQQVAEVSHSQSKGDQEKTIVTIEEIEN